MAKKKRLQVFISSTYADLHEERQAAVEAILTAGHIPAGMELFAAGDESQMNVIRRWIDDSDVFLLILGGRFGSIEPSTGKSYVQLEYEYAVATGKPVFAVAITDDHLNEKVRVIGRTAIETVNAQRLDEFRSAVTSSRIVRFWRNPIEIKLAILETMADFARREELVGWIAGDEAVNAAILAEQVARLTKDNNELRERLARTGSPAAFNGLTFEQLYQLLRSEEVSLTDFNDAERPLLLEVAALFGDQRPAVVHAFWLWRDEFLRSQPLARNDPEAKKSVFRTLLGCGLLRQTEPRLFTLTAEGRQFLLRLTVDKAEGHAERYRGNIRRAAGGQAPAWPIGFSAQQPEYVSHLTERLSERIVGQREAATRVAQLVTVRLAGLRPGPRPIASVVVAGPRGAGKTSLAQATAELLFDSDAALITIDMSEYEEAHTVSRLTGTPPGYVGFGQGGTLADKVAERPHAVVLFQDFERAHPDVHRSIHQIVAEGILTDSVGRNVDFKDTVIMLACTTRHGLPAAPSADKDASDTQFVEASLADVKRWLTPKLLDSLDDILVLRPLSAADVKHIVSNEIDLLRRHVADRRLDLLVSDEAMDFVVSQVMRDEDGAHGVRRAVLNYIAVPLGEASVTRVPVPGDLLMVDVDSRVSPPRLEFEIRRSSGPAKANADDTPLGNSTQV